MPEISSIYLGANFMYDTNLFRHNDIEGLYYRVSKRRNVQIPFIQKKVSKTVNLLSTDSIILRPVEAQVVKTKALNLGNLNATHNLLIHDEEFNHEECQENAPTFSVIPMLTNLSESRIYNVILINNSQQYLHIESIDQEALITSNFSDLNLFSIHHGSILDADTYRLNEDKYDLNFNDFVLLPMDTQNLTNDMHEFGINLIMGENVTGGFSSKTPTEGHENTIIQSNGCIAKESFPFEDDSEYENQGNKVSNAFNPDHLTGRTWEEIEQSRKPNVGSETVAKANELIDKDDTLNDHEKILALDNFSKNGFISKSCSNMKKLLQHDKYHKFCNRIRGFF